MTNANDANSKHHSTPGQARKPYVTPRLEVLGTISSRTKFGGSDAADGDFTDQS